MANRTGVDLSIHNYNYWMDNRTIEGMMLPPYKVLSNEVHQATIQLYDYVSEGEEIITCHVVREICTMCHGLGKVIDPSIDASGLNEVDEEYFTYKMKCPRCKGQKVLGSLELPKPFKKLVADFVREERSYARLCASERALGC